MTLSIIARAGGFEPLLAETLDCLMDLKDLDCEIIVTGPRDPAGAGQTVLDGRQWRYPVYYLAVPSDAKPGACLNAALRLARGEYMTFLQAGTTLSPTWLIGAVRALAQSPGSWCYSAASVRGSQNTLPPKGWPDFKKSGRIFSDILVGGVSPQTAVLPRERLSQLGGFDEDLSALVEEELLLRLSLTEPARYSSAPFVEVYPPDRTSLGALVTRCYWMTEFLGTLERAGLMESIFTKLLEDIDQADAWQAVEGYLNILCEHPVYQNCFQSYQERTSLYRTILPADTPDVSGVKDCVGCGSCSGRCPTDAITMQYSADGFLYPHVDETLCVQCGICLEACPTQRQLPATAIPDSCYAVQAEDDVRMGASSGGVFPMLAQYVLDQGGYVAGAVYDETFKVHHIVSNQPKDVQAMQTSKYVQSDTAAVYPQIRELLEAGKAILFSGCACQVAGLQAYLGKPYDNLYTMDVVCHGVPSVEVYRRYLQEFRRKNGPIVEVNFRKKEALGWSTGVYLRFASGKTYVSKGADLYILSFLSDWTIRESCYQCPFKGRKYSDLTAADFWGIERVDPSVEDGKGTSCITTNTEKGENLFRAITGNAKKMVTFGKEQTKLAHAYNPSTIHSVERPPFRDIFFDQWRKDPSSLNNALARAFQSLRFDAALILHWSSNFGNALTNYALYTYLSKNHSVIAVDNCSTLRPQGVFRTFAKKHYVCSSGYFPSGSIKMVEQSSKALVVGSDQVWNRYFNEQFQSGHYYQLDFADAKTRKIAYGSSFGTKGAEPLADCAKLYRRFYKIGVREKFGVESCKNLYNVEAEWVLDPVFLLSAADYGKVAQESKARQETPFILAYILNPNEEKRQACLRIQQQLGGDTRVISICEPSEFAIDMSRHILDFAYIQSNPTIEDFLYFFQNCQYVITDSFHGTCFSLIFQKNFMSFVNRQADRFTVFEQFGDAATHIGKEASPEFLEQCLKPLDYDTINKQLNRERERSQTWLDQALD